MINRLKEFWQLGKWNGFNFIEDASKCIIETEDGLEMAEKKVLEGFIPLTHESIKLLRQMEENNSKINEIKKQLVMEARGEKEKDLKEEIAKVIDQNISC